MKIPSQFSLRTPLEVIVIAAFVCALIYARAPSANSAGRYQVLGYPGAGQILIFDTQSGKSWYNNPGASFDPSKP